MTPTPILELTDAQIIEAIQRLRSPAYQASSQPEKRISLTHTEYLEELEDQARIRNLKIS
jgi:hypothetical protein